MATLAAHSKLGASSMKRWANCPGSVRLSEGIPNTSSVYAEEGTKAHELAAFILENGHFPKEFDPEMLESVEVYTDFVKQTFMLDRHKDDILFIEKRFDLSSIYPGMFGTADAVIYKAKEKTLYVCDYKHGKGVGVLAEDNEQLKYYALGAMIETGIACDYIEVVIVQPRFDPSCPIKNSRFPSLEIVDFAADLYEAAKATEDPNAVLNPGEHCRFCPASGVCPEVKNKAFAIAKKQFLPVNLEPKNLKLTQDELSEVLKWIPVFQEWVKSVETFAFNAANAGIPVPGFKLVEKRANRKWVDETIVSKVVQNRITGQAAQNCYTDPELKSVAQIEKVLGKETFTEILEKFVVKESSGLSLVPNDDKRTAVLRDASSQFSALTQENREYE